jgi:hypothetical protein
MNDACAEQMSGIERSEAQKKKPSAVARKVSWTIPMGFEVRSHEPQVLLATCKADKVDRILSKSHAINFANAEALLQPWRLEEKITSSSWSSSWQPSWSSS